MSSKNRREMTEEQLDSEINKALNNLDWENLSPDSLGKLLFQGKLLEMEEEARREGEAGRKEE